MLKVVQQIISSTDFFSIVMNPKAQPSAPLCLRLGRLKKKQKGSLD